jgi:hypothetical protein
MRKIGFVLHKKGRICKVLSTNVESNFVAYLVFRESYLVFLDFRFHISDLIFKTTHLGLPATRQKGK